jgi:hypothetical protein
MFLFQACHYYCVMADVSHNSSGGAAEISLTRVLALTPEKPLYGHRTGKKALTVWVWGSLLRFRQIYLRLTQYVCDVLFLGFCHIIRRSPNHALLGATASIRELSTEAQSSSVAAREHAL